MSNFEVQEVIGMVEACKCVLEGSVGAVVASQVTLFCWTLSGNDPTCRASFGLWLASSTCSLLSCILSHFIVQPIIRLELL